MSEFVKLDEKLRRTREPAVDGDVIAAKHAIVKASGAERHLLEPLQERGAGREPDRLGVEGRLGQVLADKLAAPVDPQLLMEKLTALRQPGPVSEVVR